MSGHFSSLIGAPPPNADRIPVTVLTGFLGSGKTTLLNSLLRLADLQGTAVIVNEFGEIGIDHDLISHTSEDTILLPNGCLCCTVRGDLIEAMARLSERTSTQGHSVSQVLIETSGLADPAPILHTLMGDPGTRARFAMAGTCCTVDAVQAMGTLDRHTEAVRQVAMADHVFLTKTDLRPANALQPLRERLGAMAPNAEIHTDRDGYPELLRAVMLGSSGLNPRAQDSVLFFKPVTNGPGEIAARGEHRDGIASFVLTRDEPLPREGFYAWLDMVTAMRGDDLLRVKGIVHLAEHPDQPLVFHGVQHLFHPPEFLPEWPGLDRRTRIVFITRGVDAQALDETLSVCTRRRRNSFNRTETP